MTDIEMVVINYINDTGSEVARQVHRNVVVRVGGVKFKRAWTAAQNRETVSECFAAIEPEPAVMTTPDRMRHALRYGPVDLDEQDVDQIVNALLDIDAP